MENLQGRDVLGDVVNAKQQRARCGGRKTGGDRSDQFTLGAAPDRWP
jgi:hypothetical protein